MVTGKGFNEIIQDGSDSGDSDCDLIERLQIMNDLDLSILPHNAEPLGMT